MFHVLLIFPLLFLPVIFRVALRILFGLTLQTSRDFFVFGVPLVFVAILLRLSDYSMGEYGGFGLFTMIVFWVPQLAIICFFGWCEREGKER